MTNQQNNTRKTSSCGCTTECCGSPAIKDVETRRVVIDFLYLDVSVCTWCKGTEESLDGALVDVANVLRAGDVEVVVNRIHVDSEEKAKLMRFSSSPTIRVNGRDIQLERKESRCESCGDLCGDEVDCRVWVYQGKEYTSPPKAMIIDAILREVYGQPTVGARDKCCAGEFVVPDNLRKFFSALQAKKKS